MNRRDIAVTSADGSSVHVEVYGPEGAPAVVLAHGWTCSTRFWDAQIWDLAVDHRVIAYDQRGHGGSPVPDPLAAGKGYSTEALADDLEAVLGAALGPGERAVVAGHSMGGMTIMAAARRPLFRQHAAAALLCSTGPSRLTDEALVVPLGPGRLRTRLSRAVLGSKAPLGPVTPVSKRILRYATMGAGSAPERVDACARIVHACPRAARHGWSQVLAGLDLEADVRELRLPVTVLVGAADRLTPPRHSRAMAEALPHCTGLVELAGMGHMTPVEAPEAVSAQIRELTLTYLGAKKNHLVNDRPVPEQTVKEEAEA
ncbi:alpha/beta hydrolase [Streptomyces roseicoloratus]|uniref:Alpha/beta hydrolase n=1 Tax=Streptomyces roseicoloratus TaxID=2508722 RepID=A0ABY9RWR0_9ACTN|nr:alpha/beta hydrolase [Streptomyces roseicoloratus]WMX46608.1 alpha/beta hydrolase [Streptomyces roseicoloratus]